MTELGQLLWAAQGISDPSGLRTAPSAGALYPLELYAIVGASEDLSAGIYHYLPRRHGLDLVAKGDFRDEFATAALMQEWTAQAGLILVVAAAFARTTAKYGERGRRYAAIEAGHAVQNVYLQAVALGLGATEVGAFRDSAVAGLVQLASDKKPVTSVVVGNPG
jgi:SagB-type dehydrogenase family enzyme